MLLYILTIIATLAFAISFKDDKRKLSNAFLFLISLGLIFLSLIQFVYDNNLFGLHQILLVFLYGVVPFCLFIFAIFMIINGIVTLKKERKSLSNGLSILFGLGILFYFLATIIYLRQDFLTRDNRISFYFISYGYLVLAFLFIVFIFIFFSFLAYSILYLTLPKNKDYDYIIIHGSGLIDGYKVTPLLASRIDKAIEAYKLATKEDVKFIASGGKGNDEKISEAKAISDYLIAEGIEKENIILEEKSTTTYENLKYSKEIAKKEKENPKYLFVSNNYHVFRATLYAKRLGMNGEGVGAKTAGYYIPSAFLREYVAILNKIKKLIILLLIIFVVFLYITR